MYPPVVTPPSQVSISELRRLVSGGGDMMLPSIATSFLALEQLRLRGLIQ